MVHAELEKKLLFNPERLAAYREASLEFALLRQMLKVHKGAGLSQAEAARRMRTRLESSLDNGKRSPRMATLRRYTRAVGVGRELEVQLVRSLHIKA